MVKLYDGGVYLVGGRRIVPESEAGTLVQACGREVDREEARMGTIAYSILKAHNTSGNMESLRLRFGAVPQAERVRFN